MKLSELFENFYVKCSGFPAFVKLEDRNILTDNSIRVFLSTNSPAIMAERAINTYYAPVIPRGSIFKTADEILNADLSVNKVTVHFVTDISRDDHVLICSRHAEAVEVLKLMFPNGRVQSSISQKAIEGMKVVGTLPPHLIQFCDGYKAVTIRRSVRDMNGNVIKEELMDRIQLHRSISVDVSSL